MLRRPVKIDHMTIIMKIPLGLSLVTLLSFLVLMTVLRNNGEPWRIAFAGIGFVGFLIMTVCTIYLLRRRNRK